MSTPLLILDTNILVHLVRGKAIGARLLARYGVGVTSGLDLISVVTVGEVRSLAQQRQWNTQKTADLSALLGRVRRVEIDDEILDAYVEIDTASRAPPAWATWTGRIMGKNDLWIAATARARGYRLLTTDRDFDHLAGTLVDVAYIDPAAP